MRLRNGRIPRLFPRLLNQPLQVGPKRSSGLGSDADSRCRLPDWLDRPVAVEGHPLHRNGTPAEPARLVPDPQGSDVVEEIPLSFELDDAGVDREAVRGGASDLAAPRPRPLDIRRGPIGNAFVGA